MIPGPIFPKDPLDAHRRRLVDGRDWLGYLGMFDSHHRLAPFLSIQAGLTDREYWRCLRFVWEMSECMATDREAWQGLMFAYREGGRAMMSAAERAKLRGLPDPLRVFRGQKDATHPLGFSWTTSRPVAKRFAILYQKRFLGTEWNRGESAVVFAGTVRKNCVLAYLMGRNESEVIVEPEQVESIRMTPINGPAPLPRR